MFTGRDAFVPWENILSAGVWTEEHEKTIDDLAAFQNRYQPEGDADGRK